jgi:hypothetical protein
VLRVCQLPQKRSANERPSFSFPDASGSPMLETCHWSAYLWREQNKSRQCLSSWVTSFAAFTLEITEDEMRLLHVPVESTERAVKLFEYLCTETTSLPLCLLCFGKQKNLTKDYLSQSISSAKGSPDNNDWRYPSYHPSLDLATHELERTMAEELGEREWNHFPALCFVKYEPAAFSRYRVREIRAVWIVLEAN